MFLSDGINNISNEDKKNIDTYELLYYHEFYNKMPTTKEYCDNWLHWLKRDQKEKTTHVLRVWKLHNDIFKGTKCDTTCRMIFEIVSHSKITQKALYMMNEVKSSLDDQKYNIGQQLLRCASGNNSLWVTETNNRNIKIHIILSFIKIVNQINSKRGCKDYWNPLDI